MQKGKSGLTFTFMASVSFLIAFFGGLIPALLVLGFAVAVEKNDWLTKQTVAAALLAVVDVVCHCVISGIRDAFGMIPVVGYSIGNVVGNILNFAVFVTLLIFMIMAMTKTSKGQDCHIPALNNLANAAIGIAKPKPVVAAQPAAPAAPVQNFQNPQNPQ